MADISVWAPKAQLVQVESNNQVLDMQKEAYGWWHLNGSFIQHGRDYVFRIDGKGPFPDPRSPWQPEGVFGPTRWLDHSQFEWTDKGWQQAPLGSALIYELHVGTFTPEGTFEAAIQRLDYLARLGITHIELMPVAEFPGTRGWGYDGVDLYAPHHAYGGPEGLKHLVNACHQKGLAIILDVVYNHLGPCGNFLEQFGPYFTDRYKTPWGKAVNLDGPDSDEVRRFFLDNAKMWLRDYHIDGLRIDAVHAIVDTSATHFLEQLSAEVEILERESGRHLVLIAESDLNDPRIIKPREAGGYGIDTQWNEDFHHALHTVLTGEQDGYYEDFGNLSDLAKVLANGFVYDGKYSTYRRRSHGRPAAGLSTHKFVGCLQNHDQIGNRAIGDRSSHLLTLDQHKIGATLVITSPFIPMLFQGEEWATSSPFLYFTDHPDPDLGEAVKHGRRNEFAAFGWNPEDIPDPQAKDTFLQSKLRWEELSKSPYKEMMQWYRSLIDIRHRFPALTDGSFNQISVKFDEELGWLLLKRGNIFIICNFSESSQQIPLPPTTKKTIVLSSNKGITVDNDNLSMPSHSAAILDTQNS